MQLLRPFVGTLVLASFALAQDLAVTRDGARLAGKVVEETDGAVGLESGGWRLQLPREGLRSVQRAGLRPRLLEAEQAEDGALLSESRGRFREAFRGYARAIRVIMTGLERGEVEPSATRGHLDVYLRRLAYLAMRAGLHRAAADFYRAIADHPALDPWSRDVARSHLVEELLTLGRTADAESSGRELGLVSAWFVAGPFDNERGTGIAMKQPPATEPFQPAATWQGKTRTVGWRALPAQPVDGTVDFDELYRPNDQALCYAITYLHAERETPVALRIGSDEAVRVWVDRQEVHAFKGRRPFRPDQDAAGVVLRAGWNELLVQTGDQTGAWALRLRVTAPAGGPVAGVRAATMAEIASAPKFEAAPLQRVDVVEDGARDLAAALEKDAGDWRGWFHLGYLRWARQDHDRGEHPDLDAMRKACALRPKDALLRPFLAHTSTFEAEHSVQKEENARRGALEEAVRLDPEHWEARRMLAEYYWHELAALSAARDLIAPALEAEPSFHLVGLLMCELERADGLDPLAHARLLGIARRATEQVEKGEAEQRPEELVDALIDEAREREDGAAQLRLRTELAGLDGRMAGNRMALADALWRAEREEEALRTAEEAVKVAPFEAGLRRRQAGLLAAAGKLDDAAAALEAALAITPEEPDLIQTLAGIEERRGDAARAEELLRRAHDLDPNDADLNKYLELRARNEAKAAPFEATWVIDPAPAIAAIKATPLDPRRTHRILLQQTVVRLQPDGRTSEWVQQVVRIENEQGTRAFQSYGTGYHSDQVLTFQLGRVHRRAGGTQDVAVGTWRDRGGGEFGRQASGGVRFPPLEPGDVIEVRYRTDDLAQGFFGDYYGNTARFQDSVVMDRVRWVLLAPAGRKLYWNTPRLERVGGTQKQVPQQDGGTAWVFEAEKVPAFDPEPQQPWAKELLPLVQVSTFESWDAFARWYWGLVAPQHESDPAIKQKVEELTKGAATTEEKIRKVYEYVVTDIRYNASWEFGVHGFKPYHAPRIYARKFGDCKDKATLINVMLKELGIRSYPVLIYGEDVRGKEDLALPLMNHFNHCISWVQDLGPDGMFLDGTAEHHPFGTLPSMDYGATVVVITPEKALVKEIPSPPAAENTIREKHLVKLGERGGATLETTYEANGTFGVVLRSLLATEGLRAEVLEPRWGLVYGGSQVTDVKCSDLKDLNAPVKIEMKVEVPRLLQGSTGGQLEVQEVRSWMFEQVFMGGRKMTAIAADEKRDTDVVLPVPGGVEETVIYELPPGHSVKSVPAAQEIKTPFGAYERRYEQRGRQLVSKRAFKLESRRITAAEYEQFRGFLGAVERAEGERPSISAGDESGE